MRSKDFSKLFFVLFFVLAFSFSLKSHAQTFYKLGVGDELKITVFNQEDLTGEYAVDGSGDVSLPLIGTVHAKGYSLKEFEYIIINSLKPDYLLNPRISIQVLNYRPFYILGEVKRPDSYPYVNGMTYLNAIAIAGGFTYRAKDDRAYVVSGVDTSQEERRVRLEQLVQPGDIIRIDERLF